ncbi:dihydrofolate reductase [Clostridium faecium]|uniref:dihydrofolate reductase n=1 Tax=Clostridium faecium TaxID=2762223 RepID=A0ABR8YQT4_9CLOT|nr:dihydrofolate reductase [Clostridium faecium]MBD8046373.1 dihydrofolate reductase [Clostridium faecium]
MNLIVAVDKNFGIGNGGNLLTYIPEDLEDFKKKTMGKVVVMGRTTLESLPNKAPLKNRTNIILTRNKSYKVKDAIVVNSLEDLFKVLKNYNSDDIYVIGGQCIYNKLESYCKFAYVTKIHKVFKADRHFINIDEDEKWKLEKKGETIISSSGVSFNFNIYRNIKMLNFTCYYSSKES